MGEESSLKTQRKVAGMNKNGRNNKLLENMDTIFTLQLHQLEGCQLSQWLEGAHDLESIWKIRYKQDENPSPVNRLGKLVTDK